MGYLEEAPQLAPLVVVLKSYLRDYNLNDPYTGGLSSYCLVVLLYNFVRETHQCGYLTHDCGYLLVGFLTMFLYRFEQNNQGMATMQHVDDPLVPTTYNDQGMVALGDNIMHSCYQVPTHRPDTDTPPPPHAPPRSFSPPLAPPLPPLSPAPRLSRPRRSVACARRSATSSLSSAFPTATTKGGRRARRRCSRSSSPPPPSRRRRTRRRSRRRDRATHRPSRRRPPPARRPRAG